MSSLRAIQGSRSEFEVRGGFFVVEVPKQARSAHA